MEKTLKLILTDSYFNIFPLLTQELKGKVKDIHLKNLVFCEEKISLMTERWICSRLGGSFNTDVYSFGNFLRTKKQVVGALSKEGSSMAVKRILSSVSLQCFKGSKTHLAPALYDLIAQLKSAKVTPDDLDFAVKNINGAIKNKLVDIATVYREYEKFITDNGYDDQSSLLSYLPSVIENDVSIRDTDVYLVGYTSWTSQARGVISTVLDCAKSVTVILTQGDNDFVFVNETVSAIQSLCAVKGIRVEKSVVKSEYTAEGKMLVDLAFNPLASVKSPQKITTDKITVGAFRTIDEEITRVAERIKVGVLSGKRRWSDFTVALAETANYREVIERVFNSLGIPYFFDEKKRADNHPLICLITSYIDAYRRNLDRNALSQFYKNPLVSLDKNLTDDFENYIIKYNINYSNLKEPFKFADGKRPLAELESFREYICSFFTEFDIAGLIEKLRVEDGLNALSERLKAQGEVEQSAICKQIFLSITRLLSEMHDVLGDVKLPLAEYKNVFLTGVSAMDLSLIPQYSDAVFVGGFKETALAKTKHLFVCGLTSAVPLVQNDVALLSDRDIDLLGEVSVLVEPKIRVVNHRSRENAGMAISAFSEGLYLSYPTDGGAVKSELLTLAEKLFTIKPFDEENGYLSLAQGVNSFAKECGKYSDGRTEDFVIPSSFAVATGGALTDGIMRHAKKQLKERLDGTRRRIIGGEISPTVIEDYYNCPYKAFVKHGLKLLDREEGDVTRLSAGLFIHEILNGYVRGIKSVTDKQTSDDLFYKVAEKVLLSPNYKKFLHEKSSSVALTRMLNECRNYCYKTYLSLSSNYFESSPEVSFGKGKEYGAIELLNGKISLKGKIDRVDIGEKYFRIIDYKTGGNDPSDSALFSGSKLQLYLYAKAVNEKDKTKRLAGAYYMPLSDDYLKVGDEVKMAMGKTLGDEDAINAQDEEFLKTGHSDILPLNKHKKTGATLGTTTSDALDACMDYAKEVAEISAEQMTKGYIVPSPIAGACKYCEYKTLCGYNDIKERVIGSVNEETFIQAVSAKKEGDDGE